MAKTVDKSGLAPVGESKVAERDAGQRLDRWLKGIFPNLPYIAVQKLVRQGKVRVNGVKAQAAARLHDGDAVTYPADFAAGERRGGGATDVYQVTSADMAMLEDATLYEDDAMLVLNKPAGLPAQAGGGQVRSLDRIFGGIYGDKAPKLVHRLDRETTGLLLCAKNRTMAAALTAAFAEREVRKMYLAVVVGKPHGKGGEITQPIVKVGAFAKIDRNGEQAHTSWKWLAGNGDLHVVACEPHTGRMNQIRVHMAHIGLPLLGDDKYGNETVKAAGRRVHPHGKTPLYLHAWRLEIKHPKSGKVMRLEAPLPQHLEMLADGCDWGKYIV